MELIPEHSRFSGPGFTYAVPISFKVPVPLPVRPPSRLSSNALIHPRVAASLGQMWCLKIPKAGTWAVDQIPHCPQLEINEVTRAWGLEVDRVELAVEAVLQPPHDSPAGPSLDSTLQQLTLHLLGRGTNSMAGGALPPRPGELQEEGDHACQPCN